ncbi:restriction endonuclease subunit S [Mycolicibacterium gilvum]|uniref:Restriction endonuclease S subunit n=1 Tax=Mycolicibacterium gilvum (strain DSM 45189 / LMG 24558 / Spyr1) TaxID=278137 RepID=E6TAV9_MYCSR|nr:restriction endonuclease subunit S [Mycolicibacterium gilvum]ADU01811.1 restriction endonuclease S subunit [Mycolicibacterium gilvum Spyr1]
MPLPISDRWRRGQVKNVADVKLGKMLQSDDTGDDVQADYMRAANVQPDGALRLQPKQMWFKPSELEGLSLKRGDVVVVEGGVGGFGRAAYLPNDLDGWGFQNSINRIRPTAATDGRFLAYYLIALRASGFIERYCNIVSMPHLTAEKLAALPVPVPDRSDQCAIADFLDRETARIDTLIAEQQLFVGLLRERRQAVIDSTVSVVKAEPVQLRRVIELVTSGSRGWGDYYSDAGVRFLRIGNLPRTDLAIRGEVQLVDLPPDVTEGERTRLVVGDVLFSITAYLGSVAVVDDAWEGGYVSQHVALCRLDPLRANSRFVGWVMLTTDGQDQLRQGAAGGTKQQLGLDDIRELRVPLPLLDEQHRIVAFLDEQTSKIDTLIAETKVFIELSRERRTALITAAVTGQIDVRNEVA